MKVLNVQNKHLSKTIFQNKPIARRVKVCWKSFTNGYISQLLWQAKGDPYISRSSQYPYFDDCILLIFTLCNVIGFDNTMYTSFVIVGKICNGQYKLPFTYSNINTNLKAKIVHYFDIIWNYCLWLK